MRVKREVNRKKGIRVELKKEQDNQFKTPFIILLVLFVVGVLLTIVIVVLKYLKKRRPTAEK